MNSKKTLFIVLILLTFSCDKVKKELPKKDKHGSVIFYNTSQIMDYAYDNRNKNIKKINYIIIDTACTNQKKQALADIEKSDLTYFANPSFEYDELALILKNYGLKTKPYLRGCIVIDRFGRTCYEDEMLEEINRRYGEPFLDSLKIVARKNYVKKHPNEVIMEDGKNVSANYK